MWLIIKKHISKSIVLLFKKLGIKISKYTKPSYIKIINLDYIIDITNPNFAQSISNYFVEKALKTIRVFR